MREKIEKGVLFLFRLFQIPVHPVNFPETEQGANTCGQFGAVVGPGQKVIDTDCVTALEHGLFIVVSYEENRELKHAVFVPDKPTEGKAGFSARRCVNDKNIYATIRYIRQQTVPVNLRFGIKRISAKHICHTRGLLLVEVKYTYYRRRCSGMASV